MHVYKSHHECQCVEIKGQPVGVVRCYILLPHMGLRDLLMVVVRVGSKCLYSLSGCIDSEGINFKS